MAKATARKKANPKCKTNPTKTRKGHKGTWTCTSKAGNVIKASGRPKKAKKAVKKKAGKKRATKRSGCKKVCRCVKR